MAWNKLTIRHSILIRKPREAVWDYTQDYANRAKWDKSVLAATVIQTVPDRIVKLKMKGNTEMTFVYKLDDRPHKTTLSATEVKSPLMAGGGGSWTYEDVGDGTVWSQVNTLILKEHILCRLLALMLRWYFTRLTVKGMNAAKKILENT